MVEMAQPSADAVACVVLSARDMQGWESWSNDDCIVRVEKPRGAVEAKVVARDH